MPLLTDFINHLSGKFGNAVFVQTVTVMYVRMYVCMYVCMYVTYVYTSLFLTTWKKNIAKPYKINVYIHGYIHLSGDYNSTEMIGQNP